MLLGRCRPITSPIMTPMRIGLRVKLICLQAFDIKQCVKQSKIDDTDWSNAVKKCMSQFTDRSNHRRHGRNTWLDDSALYANSDLRAACPFFRRKQPPFLERLE